jgi:hypothetical protein
MDELKDEGRLGESFHYFIGWRHKYGMEFRKTFYYSIIRPNELEGIFENEIKRLRKLLKYGEDAEFTSERIYEDRR